jgi:hypothetical protein
MGFGVRQRPRSSDGGNFVSYCRIALQFAIKSVLAQLFKAAEIVVLHVPVALVQFGSYLGERVPLNEEEQQGLALVLGEAVEDALQARVLQESGVEILSRPCAVPTVAQFVFYVGKIHAGVEVAGMQVAAPAKRTVVGDLKNPGARWSAGWVKQAALAPDQNKDVL